MVILEKELIKLHGAFLVLTFLVDVVQIASILGSTFSRQAIGDFSLSIC